MRKWLENQLRKAMEVSDQKQIADGSAPSFLVITSSGLLGLLGTIAFVPPFSTSSQFQRSWVSIVLVLIGTALTWATHRFTTKSTVGAVTTLFDNACYSSALAFAAIHTQGTTSLALVIAHALMVLVVPAQIYGLSLFFGLAMTTPLLGLLIGFRPPMMTTIVLVTTATMTLALSELTRKRVLMGLRQRRLQQALGAAEHVAEESMQAALGTTLLSLGHFLHELRNLQTAAAASITYLEMNADLDDDCRDALCDAREAQDRCTKLVTETVESLKKRAATVNSTFTLQDVVERVIQDTRRIDIAAEGGDQRFVLDGNPEHMTAVLENLVRNAVQAGARTLRLVTRIEASGQAASLVVYDDGPGIPESQSNRLFDAFAESTKVGGTGLGLYLCRRYVGLFGGTIETGSSPLGGAAFYIHLPGRVAGSNSGSTRPPYDSSR